MNNFKAARHFKFFALVFIYLLYLFLPQLLPQLNAEQDFYFPEPEKVISMDFRDASIKDVLKVFSIQSGLNFIASETVQDRKLTLYLDNVSLREAMDKLFQANNLTYELEKNSNIFIVKDWGTPQIETVTRIFYLRYATVASSSLRDDIDNNLAGGESTGGSTTTTSSSGGGGGAKDDSGITKTIKKLVSEYGSVVEDFRTNSLIVTDLPSRMPVIVKAIAGLDIPVPQVMLEVEMLDVSKNVVDKLGVKFGQTPLNVTLTGASSTIGFPFHSWFKITDAARGAFAVNTGNNTYSAQLDFLRTATDTKYLARPRILTLNNESAEIKIVTQETVGVTTTTTGGAEITAQSTNVPERVETGVSLRVTPQINLEAGEVTMFIMPKVKDTSTSTFVATGTTYFKDPEERSTKAVVKVKDGETVIMGGLIRNEKIVTITKLPFFGDLPLIGGLFRHKDQSKNKERELLVFITPHIIRESGTKLAQARKTVLPEREQSASVAVERQASIDSALNSFKKKKN